jgi:archaellum component FlaG (FlaF/FlaG flagellin family)
MRRRGILLALMCLVAAIAFAADWLPMGTWKLNEGKSKLSPGSAKNHTVVYTATGNKVRVTVDGTDADGNATHNEWVGAFDGKDYPVTGDPNQDTRSYTKVNDHTLSLTVKNAGEVTITGRIVIARDGKSRTVTLTGIDANGKKFTNIAVYDRQ